MAVGGVDSVVRSRQADVAAVNHVPDGVLVHIDMATTTAIATRELAHDRYLAVLGLE